jgi:acyl carrier protein
METAELRPVVSSSRWAGSTGSIRARIENEVLATVKDLLVVEDVQITEPMMAMGLDSLASTQLIARLSQFMGTSLSATVVFNYPTVEKLSNYLVEQALSSQVSDDVMPKPFRRLEHSLRDENSDVAIIGMSCRFPGGVESPAMFWDLLQRGACTSEKIPFERWDAEAQRARLTHMSEAAAAATMWGSFVKDVDLFDAGFFGISSAEASAMDPQQRLLLECAYLAFVDAGYTKESLMGRNVGVYVGVSPAVSGLQHTNIYSINGSDHSSCSGRISFVFGLQGPCAAYSTACSSSLVALHVGIRGLQDGDCDVAIILGCNALTTVAPFSAFAAAGMLSSTGRCHTFDSSADGYLRAEGCGAVVQIGRAHV